VSEESPLLVLTGIAAELMPDVGIAGSRAIGSDDALLRRNYVRAVFALIEGLNYARRYVAEESTHLSAEARSRAREAVRSEKKRLKDQDGSGVSDGLQLSFAAFAAAEEVDNPLVDSGPEWNTFLEAVAVRNRITHPRSGADCRVSDSDLVLIHAALRWYQELDTKLMVAAR